MQASQRAQDLERMYHNRRGHAPQISISDESHHVTEAIGDMYGDSEYSRRDSRPLSFISSPNGEPFETLYRPNSVRSSPSSSPAASPSNSVSTDGRAVSQQDHATTNGTAQGNEHASPRVSSPNPAQQQFPLNDIDYESSPQAVAQELSNLQAIRRMSMDVNGSDPDLPSFSTSVSTPPTQFADEDDASRLFWVPARLHPELAPKEFKTFIDERMTKIRRRSGDSDSLSPDAGGGGGLRRKKSMLSRQIDSGSGYRDGAERLERKRSERHGGPEAGMSDIQELEQLVEDPTQLVRRLSLSASRKSSDSAEISLTEDMPILPPKPGGQTLKRSTRTNYRRGSLRKGERVPFSRRVHGKYTEADADEPPPLPDSGKLEDVPVPGLNRVQSAPVQRPGMETIESPSSIAKRRSPPESTYSQPSGAAPTDPDARPSSTPSKSFHSRIGSNGRSTITLPAAYNPPVPQIVATPPPQDAQPSLLHIPERRSSHEPPPSQPVQTIPPLRGPPPAGKPPSRPPLQRQGSPAPVAQPVKPANTTLEEIGSSPTPLPCNQSTRTDSISFIPTAPPVAEEKKSEKKSKKDSGDSGRKTSWGWLRGGEEKEKEKEREKREKEEKDALKKASKLKGAKTNDASHDNTRLDVLQSSIDGGRGRESLVLDRESLKLEEERKKENHRKISGGETKKEKDGIFSSLFGGGKKKSDKEHHHKKASSLRGLSPEPPPRILKPDVDYSWTRFPIIQERAIYRMAHLKLANPRRELYSQVLLSNFMYSYLAKVQQQHPQVQIAMSPAQKQAQRLAQQQAQQQQQQQQKQREQQPEEFSQYQRYQELQAREENGTSDPPIEPPARSDSRPQPSSGRSTTDPNGQTAGDRYRGQQASGQSSSQEQLYSQQPLFEDEQPTKNDEMW